MDKQSMFTQLDMNKFKANKENVVI